MNGPVLTWAFLTAVQTAPSAAQWDAPSPLGGTFPGERVLILGAWAAFAQWVYDLDGRRSPTLYRAVLLALAAGVLTAPFARTLHQPAMFAVQVLAAGQLWQWARHERSEAARVIAAVQTVAAFLVFPAAQLAYGSSVKDSGVGSALYEVAGPLPGLAIPIIGTVLLWRALRRDAARLGP